MRRDYDYMLAHPEEYYGNMYRCVPGSFWLFYVLTFFLRYYKHKAAPKVDVWPVVVTLITVISVLQYVSANSQHSRMMRSAYASERVRSEVCSV